MTRKRVMITASASAAAVLVSLVAGSLWINASAEGDLPGRIERYKNASSTSDDKGWKTVTEGSVVLENQRLTFSLDAVTTHFTVTDKLSGATFSSIPADTVTAISDEDNKRLRSELTLTYYDDQSNKKYMCSTSDSVRSGNYVVKTEGSQVRVYYQFGTSADDVFMPAVFKKETFEKDILDKLNGSARRRIKSYYTLYSKQEQSNGYKEKVSQYPYLSKGDLYIMDEGLGEVILKEISKYMTTVGYTREQYEQEKQEIGVTGESLDLPTGFAAAVEYSLNDDGFTAQILSDTLAQNNDSDTLQSAAFLEYFGSCGKDKNGYILVPDGSGGVIGINEEPGRTYSQHLYATDDAASKTFQYQLSRNVPFPVFGFRQGKSGFMAIVEGAEATGTLYAHTIGGENPQNNVFTVFDLKGMDSTDIGQDRNISVFNLYSKHFLYENPQLRYILLTKDTCDYSGMASRYREYLLGNGTLKSKLDATGDMPFYLDFTGLITKEASILGVSYDKKLTLSTLSDIQRVVDSLKQQGIKNIVIRLKGYTASGLSHGADNAFTLDSRVGSIRELKALAKSLNDGGGRLYLETDFCFVYKDKLFDAFSQTKDSARRLDKSVVSYGDFDRVTLAYIDSLNPRYLVSPTKYLQYAQSYIKSLSSKLNTDDISIVWGTGGEYLSSDFNRNKDMDMNMSREAVKETFQYLSGKSRELMTDCGNAYTLPYVSGILNMPLTNSAFEAETRSVPFYQMVLHGYKEYSGSPFNLSADYETNLLDTANSGAGVYYSFITDEDELIKNTYYDTKLFSLNYTNHIEQATDNYRRYSAVFVGLRDQLIVKHEMLAEDVVQTTYENGTKVIVNYSTADYQAEGVTIKGRDFAAVS